MWNRTPIFSALLALLRGLLLAVAMTACMPLAGPFSEQAYRNATSLKAHSLALVAASGEQFVGERQEVAALLTVIDAAYE